MTEIEPETTSPVPNELAQVVADIEANYPCTINLERAERVIEEAILDYDNRPNNHDTQPEDKYVKFLKKQGLSKEDQLHAVFFISTLIFQTKTSAFFDRVSVDPKEFEEYKWIFNPGEIVNNGVEKTKEVCRKYLKPFGWQEKALDGWYHNAEVLVDKYNGSLSEFFLKYDNNAPEIAEAIYVAPRAKSYRKEFHRLGPKLTNLFLQWVERYDLYNLEEFDLVGLPVDFQLSRIVLQTGIVELHDVVNAHNLSYNIILPIIMELCKKNGWKPRIVSEALWRIGSEKCSKEGSTKDLSCPIYDDCIGVIRRNGRRDMFTPIAENEKFYSREKESL